MSAVPGSEERFKESLELAVKYAKELSCSKIHILAGLKPTSSPKGNVRCFNKMEQTYISNLKYACSRLKKDNILGVIEPICPQAVPNYFLDSFYQAMKYIKLINEPNLKLQLDFYHLQRLHGNITENLNMFFPYLQHAHPSQVQCPSLSGGVVSNRPFELYRDALKTFREFIESSPLMMIYNSIYNRGNTYY
ncbi:putative hydroxypyruvate isomerase isoform X2 [Gordionus sp. m RMFG-2023]|uniref:putative hydroxypyruvate isomerase isoform X2 n=1 Tax=Gordionus sp. m RMFG-2023 TaxID=3053472 RepID=UPI0031FCC01D